MDEVEAPGFDGMIWQNLSHFLRLTPATWMSRNTKNEGKACSDFYSLRKNNTSTKNPIT